MNEGIYMLLAVAAGFVLGLVFFGGLWLTLKKGLMSKSPGVLFVLSFIVRTGITLLGFYYVSAGSWQRLLACLVGFTIARFLVRRYVKPGKMGAHKLEKEVDCEA